MKFGSDSVSSEQIYDVLIVGAGPVGLATAIALRKRSIDHILVIDQTRDFRRVGQVVDLLPNGLKAIKFIDSEAYQQIRETALKFLQPSQKNEAANHLSESKAKTPPKRAWQHKNLQGKTTRSIPLDFETWLNLYGEGRVSISWYDLQTTLRSLLPSEIVQANHRCIDIKQESAWVSVDCISDTAITTNPFAHWEMQPSNSETPSPGREYKEFYHQQFRAKLVVAADGINSTIRRVLYAGTHLEEWSNPQYSGFGAIGCLRIDPVPHSIIEELEVKYFQGDPIITLQPDSHDSEQPRLILSRKPNQAIGYLLHAAFSLKSLQNEQPDELIRLGIKALNNAEFPPIFANLLNLSTPETMIHRPYYIHPAKLAVDAQPTWSRGRVVLVGDAAHGMPPFMAQGTNQGFEDAALISTLITKLVQTDCLDDIDTITNEFARYEQVRSPFMETIQAATMENHRWSQQQWDAYSELVYPRNFGETD